MRGQLFFKVRSPDGHEYKIYENGTTEGFPERSLVVNYVTPLLDAASAREVNAKRALIASENA